MFQGTGALAFNAAFYLQTNPDVFQAIQNGTFQGSALDHFVQFGQFEGRDPNAFFDTSYYLAENPDVLTAIADPANPSVTSAFQHFVMFGADEGVVRAPSAAFESFNAETYFAQNPDLQAAFGNLTGEAREDALFAHFLEFGVNENRPGSGVNVDGGIPGDTFALTTGVDTLTGTTGNDTFTGIVGTGATFTAGDSINGQSGTDRLNLTAVSSSTVAATTLNNVEQVYVRSVGSTTTNLDASDWSGVDQIWLERSGGTSTVVTTGVEAGTTLGLDNTTAAGVRNVAFFEGGQGTKAELNVAVNNAQGGIRANTAGTDVFTTLNVAAVAGSSTFLIGADSAGDFALSTINITGKGEVVLNDSANAVFDNVTTVNASANTGGVTVDLSDNTKDVTITGGSGDDRFVLGTNFTVKDTVNGGAGFDTVVVAGGDFSAPALAAPFNGLTNVERVEFVGGGTTLQGSTFTNGSITNLLFNTGGADTILNAGSARTYEFGNQNTGSATFELKSTATTLNIDLLGDEGTGSGGADVEGITVLYGAGTAATTVTTLNLLSDGDFTVGSNSTGNITARGGSTIVIEGGADLEVGRLILSGQTADPVTGVLTGTATGGTAGAGFTIDASGFTGDLVIGGSVNGDVLTLSDETTARVNVLLGESGDVDGPAGGTLNIVDFDVINGFTSGTGGDVLDAANGAVAASFTAVTANLDAIASTLLEATNFAIAGGTVGGTAFTGGGDGWTAFSFGGETYAVYNNAVDTTFTDGTDILVQLNDVALSGLNTTNFDAL